MVIDLDCLVPDLPNQVIICGMMVPMIQSGITPS